MTGIETTTIIINVPTIKIVSNHSRKIYNFTKTAEKHPTKASRSSLKNQSCGWRKVSSNKIHLHVQIWNRRFGIISLEPLVLAVKDCSLRFGICFIFTTKFPKISSQKTVGLNLLSYKLGAKNKAEIIITQDQCVFPLPMEDDPNNHILFHQHNAAVL